MTSMLGSRGMVLGGALALALAGLGSPGAGPSPALAGSRSATYRGPTSQRPGRHGPQEFPSNEVTFRVVRGRVVDFTIPWVAQCVGDQGGSSAPLIDRSALDPLPLRHGRFDIRGAGYRTASGDQQVASVRLDIHGRIRGAIATGTLTVSAAISLEGIYESDFCNTPRPVRWRAVRR